MPSQTDAQGTVKLTGEVGTAGLRHFSGYISEEFDADLRGTRAVKVYDEMRRNEPTVAVGLRAIKWVLGQVNWSVHPGGETPADDEAATFLDSCLDDCSHSWSKVVRDALTCLDFGFAWLEVVYKQRRGSDAAPASRYDDGRIGWRKLVLVGQDSVTRWRFDDTGGVQALVQTVEGSVGEKRPSEVGIPIEKSLLFRIDDEKGNPEGVSLLRSCYLPWYTKKMLQEIEAIGIERDLTGVPKIHLPVNATSTDMTKAKQLLEQWKADDMSGWVLPQFGPGQHERWDVDVVNSPGNKQVDSNTVIQRYDLAIARTFLAQFLLLGQQTGSWALGRDQRDLFELALGAILQMVEDIVNRFLVPPLFRLNGFGVLTALPQIRPGRISKADMTKFATAVQALIGAGILTPDRELERFTRSEFDLPELLDEPGEQQPEDTGQESAGRATSEKPLPDDDDDDAADPELPDPDDDEAWRKLEEESNKRIERAGKRRKASELQSFARPYNYQAKLTTLTNEFRVEMRDLSAQFRAGEMARGGWSFASKAKIQRHTLDGYRLGLAEARGVAPSKIRLDVVNRKAASKLVAEQWNYFKDFDGKVKADVAAGKALTSAIDARAAKYGGAARSASEAAKIEERGETKLRWVRHKEDSCKTCLANEGRVKTGAAWDAGGVWPSHDVECDGNCGCELRPEG